MSLSTFAVKSPVKVTMIFLAVILLGYISLTRLPINLFPDIRAPKVTVTVKTKGLSPAEVERRICETVERSLYTIRGVVGVQTIARADSAVIITTFDWDSSLDFAFLEVKKAVSDLQRDYAQDIESANTLRYDPNARPIVTLALYSKDDVDMEALRRIADQTLKPRFERLEGVANVALTGGIKREILISVDESLLLTYDLQVSNITQALTQDNVDATGGWIEEGAKRYLLKAVGKYQSAEEIARVVVGRKNDSPIHLEDVAKVGYAPTEAKSIVYFDGRPAVGLSFYREAESNTVAVVDAVLDEVHTLKHEILPKNWKLEVANDESKFIANAIDEVKWNAIEGGFLAILVLALFLRDLRSTLIVGIGIPISVIAMFNLMYFQGLTLNLMSLGGLALGTGMLVDTAIVVLENIFRLRQEGRSPFDAALYGAKEVGGALLASTLTSVAVFLPIVYVKGLSALLFRELALTVSYSQFASLIVGMLLIPMLAARFLGAPPKSFSKDPDGLDIQENAYTRILRLCLRFRLPVLVVSVAGLAASILWATRLPSEFLPATDAKDVALRIVLPSGTPIDATDKVVRSVTDQLGRFDKSLKSVFTRVGEAEGVVQANSEDPDGANTADVMISLRGPEDKDEQTTEALAMQGGWGGGQHGGGNHGGGGQMGMNMGTPPREKRQGSGGTLGAIAQAMKQRKDGIEYLGSRRLIGELKPVLERLEQTIPGAKVEFRANQGSVADLLGTTAAPLLVEISGPELEDLKLLAEQVKVRLESAPEVLNVRTNILEGAPELVMALDKSQLARYGLDVNGVAAILKARIEGEVATQMRQESGDVDLRVKVDYGRESRETLANITFKSPNGGVVRLGSIATFSEVRGPREIVRKRQERVAYVMADLAAGLRLSDALAGVQEKLADLRLPPRYMLRYSGEEEQRREAFGDLAFALVLSIFLVYMTMASIFESIVQPFLILFTIPMASTGVVAGLALSGQTINVMSIIGVVMLGGIVVNNAIVLLDCVNQVREGIHERRGEGRGVGFIRSLTRAENDQTLVVGCSRRLRPVFMTTGTTVLGLVPMALGLGDGAELRQSMAVTVLGGMVSSTILTLFVIPCCQSYLDSASGFVSGLLRRRVERAKARLEGGAAEA